LTIRKGPEESERIKVLLDELEDQIAQLEDELELYRQKVRRALLAGERGGND